MKVCFKEQKHFVYRSYILYNFAPQRKHLSKNVKFLQIPYIGIYMIKLVMPGGQ